MAIKINGNTVIADNQAFTTTSTISATGNVTGGNILTGGVVSATGNIAGGNVSATNLAGSLTTAAQANITSVGTLTSLNSGAISSSGNVTGANLLTAGQISAAGNITGGNIIGTIVGTVSTTSVSASGNIDGGNLRTAGLISATGAITGAALTGTSLTVTTGNITGGNLLLSGAIIDSAQLDIQTSAGNANIALSPNGTGIVTVSKSISAVGNVTAGNLLINGNAVITGNLNVQGTETIFNVANLTVNDLDIIVANNVTGGANINGAGIQAGNPATATWFYNNATTSWQSNIGITPTANGTLSLGGASNYWGNAFLTTASVTGNVNGGNLRTAGLISAAGNITTAGQFIGAGTGLTGTASSLTVGTATVAGTVTTAAQPNITSVGTMSTATITTLSTSAITKTGTNAVGNIGQTDNRFNTIFATATSALYADLAEKYTADAEYASGTVVVFGGTAEVTVDAVDGDPRVAGVVSTNPAYTMNDGLAAEFVAAVALTGRVPCLVTGTVRKGDLMVAAGLGRARAEADPRVGTVIGKALEDHDGESGTIEVVVGRF